MWTGAGPGATPGLSHPSGLGPGPVPAEPREPQPGEDRPGAACRTYVDDVPAGILVVVPDEEVDEDAPVELRVHHGQLVLQLPGGAWGCSARCWSRPGASSHGGPRPRGPRPWQATGNRRALGAAGCRGLPAVGAPPARPPMWGWARAQDAEPTPGAGIPGFRGQGLSPP